MVPLKKNWKNWKLEDFLNQISSKKLKINEIRH